jgi:signal transduction histidine kinase
MTYQRIPDVPPTDHPVGGTDARAAVLYALVITDRQGIIRRVTCPVPWSTFTATDTLPGQHVSAVFAEHERQFVHSVLLKLRDSKLFSMSGVLVHLETEQQNSAYLSVSSLPGAGINDWLFAWQFSLEPKPLAGGSLERERRLLKRLDVLESRLETQFEAAERRRGVLGAVNRTNKSLSRSLNSSRELNHSQSMLLRNAIDERDVFEKRARDARIAAREDRHAAEDARARLGYLAEASLTLSTTLDVETLLRSIAGLIVPELADCCVIDLLEDNDTVLSHAVVVCTNPETREKIEQHPRSGFMDASVSHPLRHAMSGFPAVSQTLEEVSTGPEPDPPGFLDRAADIGITAYMVAPLRSRNRIFGTITLVSTRSEHRFLPDDLRFAEDIALRAAQALDNALLFENAEKASKERDQYLSMASHELRSPLAVVSGYTSLLERQIQLPVIDREKLASLCKEVQIGVSRLASMSSDLLLSASVDAHQEEDQRRSVDLVEIVKHLIEQIDVVSGEDQRRRVSLESPDELVGTWNADDLEPAITNILSNAMKYSAPDSPVKVSIAEQGTNAVLVVQDNGIGMSSEEIADLFTPFSRGSRARATAGGTGLGLYITDKIVRQHGGSIDATSTVGQGSVFTITLPIHGDTDTCENDPELPQAESGL